MRSFLGLVVVASSESEKRELVSRSGFKEGQRRARSVATELEAELTGGTCIHNLTHLRP